MKIIRVLSVLGCLAACLNAFGQSTPPAGSDWSRVQALPAGTKVHLKATQHGGLCQLGTVTPDTLSCTARYGGSEVLVQRSDIKTIKLARQGRSAAIMGGIGAGIGVATVAAASKAIGFNGWAKGSVYAGGAGLGGVIFTPIAYFTDPFHGPTIYIAP